MDEKDRTRDEAAIRQMIVDWKEAVRRKDIARLVSFIAEDAIFMPPGQPLIHGKAEVEAMYKSTFGKLSIEQDFQIHEIEILGDWAFLWGVDSAKVTPAEGGETV